MYQGSWTRNVFPFGLTPIIMYLILLISGLFNYCSWSTSCFGIKLVQYTIQSCYLALLSNYYYGKLNIQEKWLLRRWFCSMWFKCKAPGVCWRLCCFLLALWAGGLVVWWRCDAVWYWIAGVAVLAWFQESVSDLSHLLVSGHTSIIVVYSMLY